MTLSQALAEVTLLDKKINKKIKLLQPLVPVKATEIPRGFQAREDFVVKATSDMQSVKDLIANRYVLKAAILQSNQSTTVTMEINGSSKEYTVAEAIVFRETEMTFYDTLRNHLQAGTVSVVRECNTSEKQAEAKADEAVRTMLGGNDNNTETGEAIKQIQEQYRLSTVKAPLGIPQFLEYVDLMPQVHDETLKTIDHTLSVSNATTSITI